MSGGSGYILSESEEERKDLTDSEGEDEEYLPGSDVEQYEELIKEDVSETVDTLQDQLLPEAEPQQSTLAGAGKSSSYLLAFCS